MSFDVVLNILQEMVTPGFHVILCLLVTIQILLQEIVTPGFYMILCLLLKVQILLQ